MKVFQWSGRTFIVFVKYSNLWRRFSITLRFSTLWIIVVYPLFIASHDTMQKPFLFCRWSSSSHVTKRHSTSLDFNSYGTQYPCFWIIPNIFKRFETVDSSTCNVFPSSASVWDRSSSSISSKSLSSNFSVSQNVLYQSLHVVSNRALSS